MIRKWLLVLGFIHAYRRWDWILFIHRQLKRSGAQVLRLKGKAGGPDLQIGADVFHLRGHDSSDLEVFFQVFSSKEYSGLCDFLEMYYGREARIFFVDGGANVGLATAYCAARLPAMTSVGIEPFQSNFQLASWNAHYDQLWLAALGADAGSHVKLIDTKVPHWQWGIRTQVDPEGEIPVKTLKEIVEAYAGRTFDVRVLKLDIEGAEFEVIHRSPDEVLLGFDVIVVEMHGTPEENKGLVERLRQLGFLGLPMGEYWTFLTGVNRVSG